MEGIKNKIKELREWAESEQDEIPEVFDSVEDSENWNFYEGFLCALNEIEKLFN